MRRNVKCSLYSKELWDKFRWIGPEMLVSRAGRRMFPTLSVTFNNLEAEAGVYYHVVLDMMACDEQRYTFNISTNTRYWLGTGSTDPAPPHRLYTHPSGPFTVEQLQMQVIRFGKVKLTNNQSDQSGQLILNSMHKYQPRVWLVRRRYGDNRPITNMDIEICRSFVFPQYQFITVTNYRNPTIIQLKKSYLQREERGSHSYVTFSGRSAYNWASHPSTSSYMNLCGHGAEDKKSTMNLPSIPYHSTEWKYSQHLCTPSYPPDPSLSYRMFQEFLSPTNLPPLLPIHPLPLSYN